MSSPGFLGCSCSGPIFPVSPGATPGQRRIGSSGGSLPRVLRGVSSNVRIANKA